MPRKRSENGPVQVGQLSLLKEYAKELTPPTKAQQRLVDAAVIIHAEPPGSDELAYLARELVQCTLPHRDPGQAPFWARTNGNLTLSIVSGFDPKAVKLVGYPYGSIPRLILFWITTEALRTGSRRLELGSSYNTFLREIGLDPNTGGREAMPFGFENRRAGFSLQVSASLRPSRRKSSKGNDALT